MSYIRTHYYVQQQFMHKLSSYRYPGIVHHLLISHLLARHRVHTIVRSRALLPPHMQLMHIDLNRRRALDRRAQAPAAARASRAALYRADVRLQAGHGRSCRFDVRQVLVDEDDNEHGVDALRPWSAPTVHWMVARRRTKRWLDMYVQIVLAKFNCGVDCSSSPMSPMSPTTNLSLTRRVSGCLRQQEHRLSDSRRRRSRGHQTPRGEP